MEHWNKQKRREQGLHRSIGYITASPGLVLRFHRVKMATVRYRAFLRMLR
jgi:hypothetical protein